MDLLYYLAQLSSPTIVLKTSPYNNLLDLNKSTKFNKKLILNSHVFVLCNTHLCII